MPTTELTSILAAVTQALPGPTIRSTGSTPASGSPNASAPIAWAPPATMQRPDAEQAGGPRDDRVDGAVRAGGRRDDDLVDAGDERRDDGHDEDRRQRRAAARDVAADAPERQPAALDVTPGAVSTVVDCGRWASAKARTLAIAWSSATRTSAGRASAAVASSARPITSRPSAGAPPNVEPASTTAASPRVRTSSRIARAASRTAGFGTAARRWRRSTVRQRRGIRGREIEPAQDRRRRGRAGGGGHGMIFSIGRTRMPDAPADLRRGRRPPDLVRADDGVDRDHPGVRQGDDGRRLEPRQHRLDVGEPVGGRVHHQVLAIAGRDHRADHRLDREDVGGALGVGGGVGDQDRLGREDVADRAEAVHHERRAGRDEVHDRLCEAEPRGDLDGARDRDDVDGDALVREEAAGRVGVGRRDAEAGELLDRRVRRVRRDRGGEAAGAVAERAEAGQLRAGLDEEVDAGHAEVGHAVADELDDVVRPDEQHVEVEVLDAGDEAPVVLVEDQPCVVEQRERRLDEPSLVGDGQTEALSHRSVPAG